MTSNVMLEACRALNAPRINVKYCSRKGEITDREVIILDVFPTSINVLDTKKWGIRTLRVDGIQKIELS